MGATTKMEPCIHTQSGEQVGNVKALKWLAYVALVAESDILGSHPNPNGPNQWERVHNFYVMITS